MELSKTAYVVLGMLRLGRRTGYEIKSLVDVSTRYFWAASYGQIYPELKRLEEAGLVTGEDDDSDGRRRRAYELTEAGERALHDWLTSELRSRWSCGTRASLKLFFADALDPEEQLALIRATRAVHEQALDQLRGAAPARDRAGRARSARPEGARVGHRAERVLRGLVQPRGAGDRGGEEAAPATACSARCPDSRPSAPAGWWPRWPCWPWWRACSGAAWPTGSRPTAPTTRPARATAPSSSSSARGRTAPRTWWPWSGRAEACAPRRAAPRCCGWPRTCAGTRTSGRVDHLPGGRRRARVARRPRVLRGRRASGRTWRPRTRASACAIASRVAPGCSSAAGRSRTSRPTSRCPATWRGPSYWRSPSCSSCRFVFFRSGVAALLPPMVGVTTILLTFLSLRIASEFGSVSVFALNLVTGLGLGLAIDYSLFVVSRFREEMERSADRGEALRRTLATAGRTVLFSSLTVAAAMSSLLVFPQRFLYSMGIGGVLVALLASAVALTLLPAVLMLLGPRVNALAPPRLQRAREREARGDASGAWYRLSRFVMRRPGQGGDRQRGHADRARHPLLLDRLHHRRRLRPAHQRERPSGGRDASARLPPAPHQSHLPRRRGAARPRARRLRAPAAPGGGRGRGVRSPAGGAGPHPRGCDLQVGTAHVTQRAARGRRSRPRPALRPCRPAARPRTS